MTGFTLAAAASIAVGLSIGAAATVGVTLALADDTAWRRCRRRRRREPYRALPGGIRRPVLSRALLVHWPDEPLAAVEARPPFC